MNHGKPNHENFLDHLNDRLARLMGKRDKPLKPNKSPIPGNFKFGIIIFTMLLFLWVLTGLYYVANGTYGLILQNGKIKNVINGMKIGITLPYPFADVIILDSSINKTSVGRIANSSSKPFYILSQDNQQLSITAEIAYSIIEPKRFYLNYYQDNLNLDQEIQFLTMAIIEDYTLRHDSSYLLETSNIIISNELRKLSDEILINYGLKLNKLTIVAIQNVSATSNLAESQQTPTSLEQQLLLQAVNYQKAKQIETANLRESYNQLLPQYRANSNAIVELMYYKMLNSLPAESAVASYPLLNLNLAELTNLVESNGTVSESSLLSAQQASRENPRALNRDIDRQRIFKDR